MKLDEEVKEEKFVPRTSFYFIFNVPEEVPTYKDKKKAAESMIYPRFDLRTW